MPRPRKMDEILEAHRSRAAVTGRPVLDDRTWADLMMDNVFAALDRTESSLGQHALYHRLRTTPVGDHMTAFEALIERMTNDPAARARAIRQLGRLQDPAGYNLWWLATPDAVRPESWFVAFPILTFVVLALGVGSIFSHALVPLLVLALVTNVAVHFTMVARINNLAAAFRHLAPVVAAGEGLTFLADSATAPLLGGLASDTTRLGPLKQIARWVSGDPLLVAGSGGVLGALTEFISAIYDYPNMALLLDANGAYFGGARLRVDSSALLRTMAAIGDVDAAIAIAAFRAERADWTRPTERPAGTAATLTDARHPLVVDAVPNSITLEPSRGVLITGSNMSGKSTFLRTTGVAVVMAQTVNTCLAEAYEAPILRVRSCIGRADDLLAGKSYYIVEVERLLELVRAGDGAAPHLFLLDELFRGTNTVERIAAARAVLTALAGDDGRPHMVIAATHDGELVDLTADRYTPMHFGDSLGPDGLVFDHKLQPGPATSRNAIMLLQQHGAPAAIIRQARETVDELERTREVRAMN